VAADFRRRVEVFGRVQGVAFRAHIRDEARRLGAVGWVRNRADGSVEAAFEGPRESVEALVAWCRLGPPWARVDRLVCFEEAPEGLAGFRIR